MRVALEHLDPQWVDGEHDWGCGLSYLCPIHEDHRIEVSFSLCCGGHAPLAEAEAYFRTGSSFATLTLYPTVELPGCGRMMLTAGVFEVMDH
jgi:hypothetical protein